MNQYINIYIKHLGDVYITLPVASKVDFSLHSHRLEYTENRMPILNLSPTARQTVMKFHR